IFGRPEGVAVSIEYLALWKVWSTRHYGHLMPLPHPVPAVLKRAAGRRVDLRREIVAQKQYAHETTNSNRPMNVPVPDPLQAFGLALIHRMRLRALSSQLGPV